MSIFTKVTGFFSGVPPKTVDDLFDKDDGLIAKAGAWIGNANFTSEEVAEMNAKTAADVRSFVVETMSESTDRSQARRNIAVFFIKFYALLVFMAGITHVFDPEWSKVWFALATSVTVGGLVTAISVFFFGSHAWAKHQKGKT